MGTVERVDRAGEADRDIVIRPAVDFSHIDVVLVVLGRRWRARRRPGGQP